MYDIEYLESEMFEETETLIETEILEDTEMQEESGTLEEVETIEETETLEETENSEAEKDIDEELEKDSQEEEAGLTASEQDLEQSQSDADTNVNNKSSGNIRRKSTRATIEKNSALRREKDDTIKEFYTLECEICSASQESFVDLMGHYQTEHNTRGYIRCCDKQFFQRYSVLTHIAIHQGTIRCEICHKSYRNRHTLRLHKAQMHSTDADKPFKCDMCSMSYVREGMLRSHQRTHVQAECPICKKTLSNKAAVKVHLARMHHDATNQICATCGKMFRTKPAMERHIKEHLGLDPIDRKQCPFCQKWFNGKYNLNNHVRFLHYEKGVYRCDVCGHESPNSRALRHHKQTVHVQEKYECEHCGKRFKRKLYLREHLASHTNTTLYTCEFCGMKFNSHANHFTHRKNKHPEEWEKRKSQWLLKNLMK
uniref:C2H2-type domain-containing protein n=1 Tax=Anopheles farauti TaxID=69004 RepID=A0A182Q446_9DIPT